MCCSIVMFYVEAPSNPKFGSVADCLWWGTTALTTVGYGDLYPESAMGRIVASITAFLGIGLFALPAGIITAGFRNEQIRRHPTGKSGMASPKSADEEELKDLLLGLHRRMDAFDGRLQAMQMELTAIRAETDRKKTCRGKDDAANMLFALIGAHKMESDIFTVVQLWDYLIGNPENLSEKRPQFETLSRLHRANDHTAGCPRYLGRTSSYMEFGEVMMDEGPSKKPFKALLVRFEESSDGYYRWNGPQAEEKRPNSAEWKPVVWNPVLESFCSPSMKLPNGEPRPLPNKVCAWLRGRCMKKLVSIKHSMEITPPYKYLQEKLDTDENDRNVITLYVEYTKHGSVGYRPRKKRGSFETRYAELSLTLYDGNFGMAVLVESAPQMLSSSECQINEPQQEPVTISETMEDAWHRVGASSEMLANLKEADRRGTEKGARAFDQKIRVGALRCLFNVLQGTTGSQSYWFKASLLFDLCADCAGLEELPLTCAAIARIVVKSDFTLHSCVPLLSELLGHEIA
eukprot:s165_g46.t1